MSIHVNRKARMMMKRFTAAFLSLCLMSPTAALAAEPQQYAGNETVLEIAAGPAAVPDATGSDAAPDTTGSGTGKKEAREYATDSNATSSDALYDEDGFLLDGAVQDDAAELISGTLLDTSAPQEQDTPAFSETVRIDGITVNVSAPEGVFPEGSELSVERITDNEVVDSIANAVGTSDFPAMRSYFLDVKVVHDGEVIEVDTLDDSIFVSFKTEDQTRDLSERAVYKADQNADDRWTVRRLEETDGSGIISGQDTDSVEGGITVAADGLSVFVISTSAEDSVFDDEIVARSQKTIFGNVRLIYDVEDDAEILSLKKDLYVNDRLIEEGADDFGIYGFEVLFTANGALNRYDMVSGETGTAVDDVNLYDIQVYNRCLYGIDDLNGMAQLVVIPLSDYSKIMTNYTGVNKYSFKNGQLEIELAVSRDTFEGLDDKTFQVSGECATNGAEDIKGYQEGIDHLLQGNLLSSSGSAAEEEDILLSAKVLLAATQPAILDLPRLYVTQGPNGDYSHTSKNAYDIDCANGYIADIKAMFDGTVKFIASQEHAIWFESNGVVEYANGTVSKMTVLTMHDNDVSDLYQGKTFSQGAVYTQEGDYGNASGVHLHIECINGGAGSYAWATRGNVLPNEALYLSKTTVIANAGGVTWKVYNGSYNVLPKIVWCRCNKISPCAYRVSAGIKNGTYDIQSVYFYTSVNGSSYSGFEGWKNTAYISDDCDVVYDCIISDEDYDFKKGLYTTKAAVIDVNDNWSDYSEPVQVRLSNEGITDSTIKKTLNGHTYYFVTDNYTWNEAKTICENKGGHLATITSTEEQELIKNTLGYNALNGRSQFLLGAYVYSYGDVEWITGETGCPTHSWESSFSVLSETRCLTIDRQSGKWSHTIPDKWNYYGYILEIDPKVTSVTLDRSSLQLNVGATSTLTATVLPSNAVNKNVTWITSNSSIATVTSGGVVKGVAPGTAKITVKTNDGGYTAECTVTVKQPVISVSLNKSSLTLEAGKSETLKATVAPSNASNKAVTWSSSNTSVATVNSNGQVTAKNPGTATITVKTNDGGKTATCKVTVIKIDPVEEFVKRLYNGCYGRAADNSGLNYWTTGLKNGSQTGASAAKFFFLSSEMNALNLSDGEYINRLYTVMMGRTADASGRKHWLEFASNGMSREWLVKSFIDSNEFTQICQDYGITKGSVTLTQNRDRNYGVTSFMARIYLKALGRSFDVDGLNYWTGQILDSSNKKETMISAAMSFLNSKEFKNKDLNNTEYVKVLYRTFFGREYDDSGLNYWKDQLVSGKATRDAVLKSFANSKEFANLMKEYGIQ